MTFATATIQERIRSARCLRGLSQRALATAAGVGQCQVWLWESGGSEPTSASILRVAQALQVNMLWLTFGEGPMDVPVEKGA